MAESRMGRYLSRFKALEGDKEPWKLHYQALAEIFLTRKSDFTQTITPGEFLQDQIFDNTGLFAAHTAASVFLSMMWPDSSRTFTIRPVRRLANEAGVEKYFKFVTEEMRTAMDAPRAGLALALMEHFLDQMVFGTSGVGAFEGPESDPSLPVVYDAWGVKNMCISENAQGFVDTVFFKRSRTVREIVEEYGAKDKVAKPVLDAYREGRYEEKIEVLVVIEPKDALENTKGVAAMTCRTVHIDIQNKMFMRESGYQELPVFVVRMFKTMGEVYGRSSGMTALPDARSLNALSEGVLVATEKQLDPPLGVLDDGRLGGGVIDTSAGSLNVFNASGRMGGEKPIFPLFTVGEMQSADKLQERLEKKIMQAFFLDRLLDLNNATQMTAFETSVRNKMRGESLGSLFARQEAELFTPLIERTFNILYRSGRLGKVAGALPFEKRQRGWDEVLGVSETLVPDVVARAAQAGLDVFEIEYISPAKRFMQSEKLQGILTTSTWLETAIPVIPGLTDNIDSDIMARDVVRYSGAPTEILRTAEEVTKLRVQMAQQQAKAQQLEAAQKMSEIGRNLGQTSASLNGAQGA